MFTWKVWLFSVGVLFATEPIRSHTIVKTYSPPQSALVIEYSNNKTKVLYQQQANATRHPASLTKMMTVYMLLEALQSRQIKPTKLFYVSHHASAQMPSKLNLKPGSYISAIDCVKALLVKSANDVAVVVAEGLAGSVSEFCRRMNSKAKALGMGSTHFENPSGVPNKRQITTANDIAKLGLALYKKFPQYWNYFSLKNFTYNKTHYGTHCKILGWYKGSDGAKTGFINASGFNLWVTARRYSTDGSPKRLFAVVFGGSSGRERDFKAARLMDKFFKGYLRNKPISKTCNNAKHQIADIKKLENVKSNPVKSQPSKKNIIKSNNSKCETILQPIKNNISTKTKLIQQNDEVLYELDSTPIDDILVSSGQTKEYFDHLYRDEDLLHMDDTIGEEPLQIIETVNINQCISAELPKCPKTTIKNKPIAHKTLSEKRPSKHKNNQHKNRKRSTKLSTVKRAKKAGKEYRQTFNRTIDQLL